MRFQCILLAIIASVFLIASISCEKGFVPKPTHDVKEANIFLYLFNSVGKEGQGLPSDMRPFSQPFECKDKKGSNGLTLAADVKVFLSRLDMDSPEKPSISYDILNDNDLRADMKRIASDFTDTSSADIAWLRAKKGKSFDDFHLNGALSGPGVKTDIAKQISRIIQPKPNVPAYSLGAPVARLDANVGNWPTAFTNSSAIMNAIESHFCSRATDTTSSEYLVFYLGAMVNGPGESPGQHELSLANEAMSTGRYESAKEHFKTAYHDGVAEANAGIFNATVELHFHNCCTSQMLNACDNLLDLDTHNDRGHNQAAQSCRESIINGGAH